MRKLIIFVLSFCLLSGIIMLTACEENLAPDGGIVQNESLIPDGNGVDLIIKDVNKLQEVNKNQNSKNIDVDITVLDATDDSLTLEYSIDNFYDGDKGVLTVTIDGYDYTFDVDKSKGIIKLNLKKPLNEDSKLIGSFELIK